MDSEQTAPCMLELVSPDAEVLQEMYTKIGTSTEKLQQDMEVLQKWLSNQSRLPSSVDPRRLRWSLLVSKNNLEEAKKILDTFFTVRVAASSEYFFRNRDPLRQELQAVSRSVCMAPLPLPTPEGLRIVCFKIFDPNFHGTPAIISDYMKLALMGTEVRLLEDLTFGNVLILDTAGINGSVVASMRPWVVRKYTNYTQNIYKAKIKAIHIINASSYIEPLLVLFKPFFKDKIFKRISFHPKNKHNLLKVFSQDIMPQDFGGSLPSLAQLNNEWLQKIVSYREWFKEDEQSFVDKRKGSSNSTFEESEFGIDGSFRKLNID